MSTLIATHPRQQAEIARRQAAGADRWDEVWEGEYVLMPLPNDEHQALVARLVAILEWIIGMPGLGRVRPGVNITDREDHWTRNYRCPDVVVFLNETAAENCGSHWFGGPDFAIEVVSPGDRTLDKLPFYSDVGVRELLVIDRDPWSLELDRRDGGLLRSVGRLEVENPTGLRSEIVPLTCTLRTGTDRPQIEVRSLDGQCWLV